jgi:hypothetical protein
MMESLSSLPLRPLRSKIKWVEERNLLASLLLFPSPSLRETPSILFKTRYALPLLPNRNRLSFLPRSDDYPLRLIENLSSSLGRVWCRHYPMVGTDLKRHTHTHSLGHRDNDEMDGIYYMVRLMKGRAAVGNRNPTLPLPCLLKAFVMRVLPLSRHACFSTISPGGASLFLW